MSLELRKDFPACLVSTETISDLILNQYIVELGAEGDLDIFYGVEFIDSTTNKVVHYILSEKQEEKDTEQQEYIQRYLGRPSISSIYSKTPVSESSFLSELAITNELAEIVQVLASDYDITADENISIKYYVEYPTDCRNTVYSIWFTNRPMALIAKEGRDYKEVFVTDGLGLCLLTQYLRNKIPLLHSLSEVEVVNPNSRPGSLVSWLPTEER